MAKWIEFVEVPAPGVTKRWEVRTKEGARIGGIGWYGGWRRYVYWPLSGSFYEQDCLRDVAEFLETQTRDRRAARAAAKALPDG